MYELKLVFDPEPISSLAKESITYAATIDLFLRGTSQSSASRILFESDRDRMLAVLILCASSVYTPVCVD